MRRRIVLLLILTFSGFINLLATISFQSINVEDGLSQTTVYSIYQDEFDRLWFGTRDGLNCYDKNKVVSFKFNPADTNSLFSTNVEEVTGDRKGSLFLRCKNGLVRFDLKTQRFTTIADKSIYAISYGTRLWAATKDKIVYYDPAQGKLVDYCSIDSGPMQIAHIKEFSNNQLYVGTRSSGLFLVNRDKVVRQLIPKIGVNSIYEDSRKNIWICSRQNGLYRLSPAGEIANFTQGANSLSSDVVRSIVEDNGGNYWVGTFSGLDKFDAAQYRFVSTKSYNDQLSVETNSVLCLYKDIQGSIWIGLYYGGVHYFNPQFDIYTYYKSQGKPGQHLSSAVVGKMAEDKTGNIWIATEGGGLNYLNRQTKEITYYKNSPSPTSISSDVIKSVFVDEQDPTTIWAGAIFKGLNRFDSRSRIFTHIKNNLLKDGDPEDYSVRKIVQSGDTLFVATHSGLLIYKKSSDRFARLDNNDKIIGNTLQVIDMCFDKKNGMLWGSNSSGVFSYNIHTRLVKSYPGSVVISPNTYNNVTCLLSDNSNNLWLGTSGDGLIRYDAATDKFTPFETGSTKIDHGYILALEQSRMGYLLMATNDGLFRIDPREKTYTLMNHNSGFPLSVINDYSIFVARDGEIFVGGITGMISFYESSLDYPLKNIGINIVGIEINNMPFEQSAGISPLYLDKITLKPSTKVFSVEFVTNNYIKALENDVEYRLVGFDKGWVSAGTRRLITYTNLEPGNYKLQIRLANQPAESGYIKELDIHVETPFYLSFLAFLLYFGAIISVIILIFRFYSAKIRFRSTLEFEKREKEQIENLNRAKQEFFINISHELRTPLTLITGYAHSLLQAPTIDPESYKKVRLIANNSERTNRLITELLDFNKLESGRTKLKLLKQNVVPQLEEIYQNFKELAQYKNINYTFTNSAPDIELYIDAKQFEKVFYNLLSNAFNYTNNGGAITLSIDSDPQNVSIKVADTGVGIAPEHIDKIFERYYRVDKQAGGKDSRVGSGIGLYYARFIVEAHGGHIEVTSNPGSGSVFKIVIPFHPESVDISDERESSRLEISKIRETLPHEVDPRKVEELMADDQKPNLLIVEDNDQMVTLLVDIFEPYYTITTASDGEQGLEYARKNQPDLIVSDVMMPRLTGIEMCQKLKTSTDTSHISLVLLTAKAAMDYKLEGLQTGADDYITKPFNPGELLTRCNNIITSRRQLQKKFSAESSFSPQLITTNDIDQRFMQKLIAVVEGNISTTELSVEFLSREMGLGRTNLFAKIKSLTGMTPNEFILNARLKKSMELVRHSSLNISEIAYEVGFSSSSYFIKCFKQLFGKTPSEFRG